jgi:hypothetical protein
MKDTPGIDRKSMSRWRAWVVAPAQQAQDLFLRLAVPARPSTSMAPGLRTAKDGQVATARERAAGAMQPVRDQHPRSRGSRRRSTDNAARQLPNDPTRQVRHCIEHAAQADSANA